MRSNRKILFGLLLILGAFGFYRLFQSFSARGTTSVAANNSAATDPNLRPVSVQNSSGRVAFARMNIPANTIVTPDMLRMDSKTGGTEGYITDIESQGAGFITAVPISAKTPIRPDQDFVGHISETGIAGLLRPGTRAMVVPIANKPTLHDLVRVGNYVDVLAAFDGQESRSIVQNVRVLGVDVSANDYPNINAAMRGPFKADAKKGAPQPAETPGATPTTSPNAPKPDPAITLEVTPRQAAALQLALSSNSTLDYLVRPAFPARSTTPGNPSAEASPVQGDDNPETAQSVSVVKAQIAPYAERRKNANGGGTRLASTGDNGASLPTRGRRNPIYAVPDSFPTANQIPPANLSPNTSTGSGTLTIPPAAPLPTPTQNYVIPIYGDGKILRTETVPLPDPSR